jgi:hypothetical protein
MVKKIEAIKSGGGDDFDMLYEIVKLMATIKSTFSIHYAVRNMTIQPECVKKAFIKQYRDEHSYAHRSQQRRVS